uniref:Sterol regulatory element-binding protein cleavage-activating protein n=1 Tax=Culex pipiens TaxID=7175 RepID=A0A8D8I3J1_CULPI
MTSSSSIDSQFTPGGNAGGGGDGGGNHRRSPPLQQQNYYSHHHHQQQQHLQHSYGGALVTGSMATTPPTTPPIGNGKLGQSGMPAPIPATIGNGSIGGGGSAKPVRTISRNRATVGRDGEGKATSTSLPSRVSQIYYKHGLFLSSYPTCATSLSIALIIFCCYPLLNIPLPGTIPTKVVFPYTEQIGQNLHLTNANSSSATSELYNPFSFNGNNIFNIYNISVDPPFPWARIEPLLYVQQIILRSSVVPWTSRYNDLQLTDAYRGPLYEVFKLIEIVRNHEDENSKTTLSDICLHVENVKRPSQQMLFPEYNCLLLSPANLWQQNIQNFNKDSNLLNTVFVNHVRWV